MSAPAEPARNTQVYHSHRYTPVAAIPQLPSAQSKTLCTCSSEKNACFDAVLRCVWRSRAGFGL